MSAGRRSRRVAASASCGASTAAAATPDRARNWRRVGMIEINTAPRRM
jgi:hypothetical protein